MNYEINLYAQFELIPLEMKLVLEFQAECMAGDEWYEGWVDDYENFKKILFLDYLQNNVWCLN